MAPSREAPLMASLLNNIEQDQVTASAARSLPPPQPAAKTVEALPAARDSSAMDVLVKQINDGEAVASAEVVATRTETVQVAMRRCPRANTRAGLRCREKVCSRFRGLDRACPD
ncbi:hypothetical protein IP90_00893 [Luteimonas cucumeris]|uniref:Uncharacterized protein n=2 Tax=Luteimonas cucumeris TaxID=985012 RepID=A0A562LAS1_9GAMM|nr:hypothetical protein IP90_00893 [Luteimonas cucumeris]